HLSNCSTLQEMTQKGRFERYVIATEHNGIFRINIIGGGQTKNERHALHVCQNCLHSLSFDGFNLQMNREIRAKIVREFVPDRFFDVYPRSLHSKQPTYNSDNAPLNNYTPDFRELSARVRQDSGWKCEGCARVLADHNLRHFLDVHH